MIPKNTLLAAAVSLIITAMVGFAAPIAITQLPITITQPGYYQLVSNLIVPGTNPAILITSSDVTLDLQGYTLNALNSNVSVIEVGYAGKEVKNVIVQNGTIEGNNTCIEVTNNGTNPNASGQVHDLTFLKLTLSLPEGVLGGDCVYLGNVYNINIINCSITGGYNGIDDRDFGGDHFINCSFTEQTNFGVVFRGSIQNMNTNLNLPTQTTP
jgi:hypothetical protein